MPDTRGQQNKKPSRPFSRRSIDYMAELVSQHLIQGIQLVLH